MPFGSTKEANSHDAQAPHHNTEGTSSEDASMTAASRIPKAVGRSVKEWCSRSLIIEKESAVMTSQVAHTPGRLKQDDHFRTELIEEKGCVKASTCVRVGSDEELHANARHLAAAWNAAHDAGLSTEALEAGMVEQMVALLKLEDASPGFRTTLVKIRAILAMIGEGK